MIWETQGQISMDVSRWITKNWICRLRQEKITQICLQEAILLPSRIPHQASFQSPMKSLLEEEHYVKATLLQPRILTRGPLGTRHYAHVIHTYARIYSAGEQL